MDPEQLLFGLNVTEYEIGHTIIFGVVLFFVSMNFMYTKNIDFFL
jgi:hypothetical protein